MRPDLTGAPLAGRALLALRAGDMTSIELAGRLRACPSNLARVLRDLEAQGLVRCLVPRHGCVPSEWALVREQERRAS